MFQITLKKAQIHRTVGFSSLRGQDNSEASIKF